MSRYPFLDILKKNAFSAVLIFAVLIAVFKAIVAGFGIHENFAGRGNDSVMRLLTVRDWLAGQGWYDVAQYRLMPPEGVSLHWSRYIDAGMASIIIPASLFLPMTQAEMLAVTVWPTALLIISTLVIGFGTRRVFGAWAACFAMMCTVCWPVLSSTHVSAGDVDHHNVQMLMMTLMAFAVVWPSRPYVAGIVGGLAAAVSLAVGLESLVFIVGLGAVAFVRAAVENARPQRQFLVTFCVSLTIASVVLWLGQTGPAIRMDLMCDQLAPPTLMLVGIACMACIALVLIAQYERGIFVHVGMGVLVVLLGLFLVWPFLSHCMAGPYAQIPDDLRDLIGRQINEAKPAWVYFKANTASALVFALPIFTALIAGSILWFVERKRGDIGRHAHAALGTLIIIGLAGLPIMFIQIRAVIIPASVVPMIGGVVITHLMRNYLRTRSLSDGLAGLLVTTAVLGSTVLVKTVEPLLEVRTQPKERPQGDCRSYSSLNTLNEVAPAIILNHVNFGPALIWATHHSVLSAPYHRSTEAFMNGIVPFQLDQDAFKIYVTETKATHLLLCRGFNYQSEYVRGLATGDEADWLRRVPVSNEDQLLFEILR